MASMVTLHFQSTGTIPGDGRSVQMHGAGLTLGRGSENDVELPDPDRMLSKRHCAIEDHNGSIIAVDMSTNGTFLNYGKLPLGTIPTPLHDGDILSLGSYEIMVSISADGVKSNVLADPLEDGAIGHGDAGNAPSIDDFLDAPGDGVDFLDDLLGDRNAPVGPRGVSRDEPGEDDGLLPPWGEDDDPLLPPPADPDPGLGASSPAHNPSAQDHFLAPSAIPSDGGGSAIPDDWDDDFLASDGPPMTNPFAEPTASPVIIDDFAQITQAALPIEILADMEVGVEQTSVEPIPAEPMPVAPTPVEPATVAAPIAEAASAGGDAAARAFLKSLGADGVTLAENELTPVLSRMGHVMRVLVEGIREILMTRTSIKSEFRIEQTMIKVGGNNPLKFSISPEQAIEAMVRPSAKGYLDATEAANQALQDIKAHEIAMITGMESALKGILAKLDPAILEEKIQDGGGFGSMLKSKKARYWEVYESMYAEISDQAENDFHELFAREFSRAYQAQLDKLK
jgi:type VI secretion system FHA domain protein